MGNHNVAMVEGKENYIFAEEEVVKSLTEAEKEAIFQHELGHLQGISALCEIDKMNCKTKIDMDLSHPKLRKQIDKIKGL